MAFLMIETGAGDKFGVFDHYLSKKDKT